VKQQLCNSHQAVTTRHAGHLHRTSVNVMPVSDGSSLFGHVLIGLYCASYTHYRFVSPYIYFSFFVSHFPLSSPFFPASFFVFFQPQLFSYALIVSPFSTSILFASLFMYLFACALTLLTGSKVRNTKNKNKKIQLANEAKRNTVWFIQRKNSYFHYLLVFASHTKQSNIFLITRNIIFLSVIHVESRWVSTSGCSDFVYTLNNPNCEITFIISHHLYYWPQLSPLLTATTVTCIIIHNCHLYYQPQLSSLSATIVTCMISNNCYLCYQPQLSLLLSATTVTCIISHNCHLYYQPQLSPVLSATTLTCFISHNCHLYYQPQLLPVLSATTIT
jgi:hypothetical protein